MEYDMNKIYTFLADGLEEIECLAVVDLLRRANIEVCMVSMQENLMVTGAHNISIQADALFEDIAVDDADLLFLPGGMPGTAHLAEHEGLKNALLSFAEQGKRIAAICAAPSILGELGILKEKKAVCFPGFESKLFNAYICEDKVVTDSNITTAKGMGCALDLGLELIRLFLGEEAMQVMKKNIQY